MRADSYRQIFVYYPRGVRTGGPEALHQLVQSLRKLGCDAFLVPQPGTENALRAEEYNHYEAPEASYIDDSENNVVVTSEYAFGLLRGVVRAERFIWWLSIDNSPLFQDERRLLDQEYLGNLSRQQKLTGTVKVFAKRVQAWQRGDYKLLRQAHHLTQSSYASAFLYARFNLVSSMLSDYTAPLVITPTTLATDRGKTIAYNPKKAAAITMRLADAYPEATFVPLINMTQLEVLGSLASSAVYLDLGTHPGKDRMPREAVLSGCVTLVARRGSGAFDLDVPVPPDHKLPTIGDPVEEACELLDAVFSDVGAFAERQANYFELIASEREIFEREVSNIFVQRLHQ